MKSRILYTGKNIFWGYISTFLTTILSFVCRTAFIKTIGVDYLGINGLFTSVLGVLSLTELGIGTAMNYSLYKPVADNDTEKIKSLMGVFKSAYRIVALTVAVLGLVIIPFLDILVKDAQGIAHIKFYYLFFLFNTVSSYFVSYKYSLVNADQKHYVITNITAVFNIAMHIFQIVVLFLFKNYVAYLGIQALMQLIQKIYTAIYIDNHYPFLKEKNVEQLEKDDKKKIIENVKALIMHKIGEISVNQTDNIIISAFVNVTTVGLVSNYALITNTVNTFVNIAFGGTTGSLGNLFASGDKEKQYKVFRTIDFIDFWIYSFSSVALFTLIQPFISLMWGEKYTLPIVVVGLFVLNNYMMGQRISINNIKVAGGIFNQDKYLALIQSVVNLVVSIVLALKFGLIGVYIGTIVSGIVPSLIRPYIVYKNLFENNVFEYYKSYFVRLGVTLLMCACGYYCVNSIMTELTWLRFFICTFLIAIIPNLILFVLYFRTYEFKYLISILKGLFNKFLRRNV